ANNQFGTFAFNSIGDLQSARPASFSRQLTPIRGSSGELIGGLSIGDSYRPTYDLQIIYGARLDANRFLDRPSENVDVKRLFGVSNDRVPDGLYISPRIGFSWTYGAAPQISNFAGAARVPRAVLRGGIGIFQGVPTAPLPSLAIANTGLASGTQLLTCSGQATPAPDWTAFASS